MKKKFPTFFFFINPETEDSAQLMAHVTSACTILFALDLLFGINPIKTVTSGFLPIKLGAKAAASAGTTTATA